MKSSKKVVHEVINEVFFNDTTQQYLILINDAKTVYLTIFPFNQCSKLLFHATCITNI